MLRTTLLMLLALGCFRPAEAAPLRCDAVRKVMCSPVECRPVAADSVVVWVDLDAKTVRRCDAKGCGQYQATVTTSGAYTNVEMGGQGAFLKIEANSLAFTEVATAMLFVVVSHGICRVSG